MAEYIDREKLIENLEQEVEEADDWKTAHEIANVVKYFPTADVRENKHGHWIKTEDGDLKCSECGRISCDEIYEYEPFEDDSKGSPRWVLRNPYFCAKCGADMRGDNE